MNIKKVLSFDDVLLTPKISDIASRQEIDLTSKIGDFSFRLPIISSPMDTVTETSMASTMNLYGGLGVIHRYNTIYEQTRMCSQGGWRKAAAIGVSGEEYLKRAKALYDAGVRILCVDVAHGHHSLVKDALGELRDAFGDSVCLMAGNVATLEAFNDLSDWGADAIRVGIGGGSICSTRIQTGHGVPTFQSVLDCARSDRDTALIADGGIKNSGDIVKALAAGADFVMLGSLLAGTDESPGSVHNSSNGKKYKVYRGMASVEAQVDWRGEARSLEGISTTISYKGSVKSILDSLAQNIKSGLSYSGSKNIQEFQSKAQFILQTAAGQSESSTHILSRA